MIVTEQAPLPLMRSGFLDLEGLYEPWSAAKAPSAQLVVLNEPLAAELGLDVDALRSPDGVAGLTGNGLAPDVATIAQAYAGHQFGGWSPRLGDGRALLLGELIDRGGRRRELHLKGSGPTPFARGGDGWAALGPMLREHVVSESMHALGIPTTRSLAVVATGRMVAREALRPGAVLARIAASHVRVGTFQYARPAGGVALLRRLADHTIERLHPDAADAPQPYVALYDAAVEAQAALVARWMLVGFVHGVMNTDNMTISGETIDYGPCAFIDAYDPATVFSSIDHGGRYAYGNQPAIAQWDLARLGEAMLPLFAEEEPAAAEVANEVLQTYTERFQRAWMHGIRAKLGLTTARTDDAVLVRDLLELMRSHSVDYTSGFRALSAAVCGDERPLRDRFAESGAIDTWTARWSARRAVESVDPSEVAEAMDRVNPVYIPRNHLVEEALAAGTDGDLAPLRQLLHVVSAPFVERPGLERYAEPAPAQAGPYRTFCGT